ncbi:hypothetical protein CYLTODRAFT_459999 [Cylindrobasidium torrendii FP15055 ss-10]|uniref:Uncharacterized protein n=1 Tax=Cylindrobasidium torrendii FP15055 ss-10 TaxID=1314674 RepID=A0A0D7ASU2_9AGAR|nr:hypothetical protein CYLTODRAFT_459999 [Cylindrobasidium torrendii FP15055 ss-10]
MTPSFNFSKSVAPSQPHLSFSTASPTPGAPGSSTAIPKGQLHVPTSRFRQPFPRCTCPRDCGTLEILKRFRPSHVVCAWFAPAAPIMPIISNTAPGSLRASISGKAA